MASGIIIANVRVTNPQQYDEYKKWSTAALQTHGVEVLARGGRAENLEGDWQPERVVVLRFPSVEAARAFYDSPEYTRARTVRAGAAIMRMVVVEGV